MKVPAMEVADVMRAFGGEYVKAYGGRMPAMHRKTMADMTACRTLAMGGTTFWCPSCHHYQYSYHSCGNRWLQQVRQRKGPAMAGTNRKAPAAGRAFC